MSEIRIPLHNIEAEMSVIGSMLLSTKAAETAISILDKEDFFRPAHQTIFDSCVRLLKSRFEIDIITLKNDLVQHGQIENCGGIDYLMQIAEQVPSVANVKHYSGIVREKAQLRRLDNSARAVLDLIHDPEKDLSEKQSAAESLIQLARKSKGAATFTHIGQVFMGMMAEIDEAMATGEMRYGVPTGFDELDRIITGFVPGEMILIGARPAMAKTSLAMQLDLQAAKQGVPTAIWSAEMTTKKIAERILSSESGLSARVFREVIRDESVYTGISDAMESIYALPLAISDTTPNPEEMLSQAREFQRENGGKPCLFITDYAQLIANKKPGESTNDAVSRTSKACLSVAKELDSTHIVLSQLSRDCERRDNKRPMLSDLRDSGALEQDAQIVLGLYRDEYYAAKAENREESAVHQSEVICLKNRSGRTGVAYLAFQPSLTRFRSMK